MLKNAEAKLDNFYCCVAGNTEFFELMGARLGNSIEKRIHPDDTERFERLFGNCTEEKVTDVFRIMDFDNEYRWVTLTVSDIRKKNIPNVYWLVEICDILDFQYDAQEFEQKLFDYRTMLSAQRGKYFTYYKDTNIFKMYFIMNDEEVYIYNDDIYDIERIILKEYKNGNSRNVIKKFINTLVEGSKSMNSEFEITMTNNKGEKEIWVFTGEPIYNFTGDYIKYIGVIKSFDINTREDMTYYKVERNRDTMTGLLNKSALSSYARQLIQSKVNRPITIAIMDIDDFKGVNDYGGHSFGDEVLVSFAEILKEAVGKRGIVGRFGGDEFFVVLDGISDKQHIRSVLRSIKTNFKTKYAGIDKINIGCSIGAAVYPNSTTDYDELFKMADYALYRAKMNGKNRYVIYDRELHGPVPHSSGNIIELGNGTGAIDYMKAIYKVIECIDRGQVYDAVISIGTVMNIGRINIICGENFEVFYTWGEPNTAKSPFSFLSEDKLPDFFDEYNLLVIDTKSQYEDRLPLLNSYIVNNEIGFCVFFLMGSKDNVKGYITFEYVSDRRKLKNDEVLTIAAASKVINSYLLKEDKK